VRRRESGEFFHRIKQYFTQFENYPVRLTAGVGNSMVWADDRGAHRSQSRDFPTRGNAPPNLTRVMPPSEIELRALAPTVAPLPARPF
jgi:hypothetical protein